MKKNTITKEESKLALQAQAPIDEARHETSIARVSSFKQLAKVSRSSKLTFGSASQWVKPEMLFSPDYENGLMSAPFYITNAFSYKSPARNNVKALGVEMAFADGHMYICGFGLNQGDLKRNRLLSFFEDSEGKRIENAEPIGPFMIVRLSMPDKPNDYYDIVPYEKEQASNATPVIAFKTLSDDEIPF
jgi:hypothetical protein